jgi:hypothetical protein
MINEGILFKQCSAIINGYSEILHMLLYLYATNVEYIRTHIRTCTDSSITAHKLALVYCRSECTYTFIFSFLRQF